MFFFFLFNVVLTQCNALYLSHIGSKYPESDKQLQYCTNFMNSFTSHEPIFHFLIFCSIIYGKLNVLNCSLFLCVNFLVADVYPNYHFDNLSQPVSFCLSGDALHA